MKKTNFELWLGLRYLFPKKPSSFVLLVTFFSLGSVFLGVAALIVSLSLMNGFEDEIRSRLIGTNAHITMHSFEKGGMPNWQENKQRLEELSQDVVAAAPFIASQTVVANKTNTVGIMIRGVDITHEKRVSKVMDGIVSGAFWEEVYSQEIPPVALGSALATSMMVIPGDTVVMYTLKKGGIGGMTPKPKRFQVMAVFETGLYDFDSQLAYIPLEVASGFFGMGDRVTGLTIKLKDFYEARKFAEELDELIGWPNYFISWAEQNENLYSWMTLEKWGLALVLSIIIAVAAFNIASTLIMVVLERTDQIGILRAMGISRKSIVRIFMVQGIIVGVSGTILGAIVGISLCLIQQKYGIISLPSDLYNISKLPMQVRFMDVFWITFFSFTISVVSAIYPAKRAASLDPLNAIRR